MFDVRRARFIRLGGIRERVFTENKVLALTIKVTRSPFHSLSIRSVQCAVFVHGIEYIVVV